MMCGGGKLSKTRKFSFHLSISYIIVLIFRVGLGWMEQKGMTFDHDFCYFILLFSFLLKKEGREKENDGGTCEKGSVSEKKSNK
jgi:hypothetical protein